MKINIGFVVRGMAVFAAWWLIGIAMAVIIGTMLYINPPEWIKQFYIIQGVAIGTMGGLFWMLVSPT